MSPRLVRLLLASGIALHLHAALRMRRIIADAVNFDGDPDSTCPPWCPCHEWDDEPDEPTGPAICGDRSPLRNGTACNLPAGHADVLGSRWSRLHAADGYLWANGRLGGAA